MALPTKLNATDVKNWAKKKMAKSKKGAIKAAGKASKVPGKAKAPADDPTKTALKAPKPPQDDADNKDKDQDQGADDDKQPTVSVHVHTGKPNTEPQDPMNSGGPEVPQDFIDAMEGDGDDDEDAEPGESVGGNPEIEEKLGDFAETLEHRAGELEELATEVDGDLSGEEVDMDTTREVQSVIPEDLKQDLVEHLSALTDEEVTEFCQHLAEQGRIEDPDLMANFLRAAAADSSEDDAAEGDEDIDEEDSDADDDDVSQTSEDEAGGDDSDDQDDEDKPKAAGKKAPPFGKKSSDDDDEEDDDEDEEDDSPAAKAKKKKAKGKFPPKKAPPFGKK